MLFPPIDTKPSPVPYVEHLAMLLERARARAIIIATMYRKAGAA